MGVVGVGVVVVGGADAAATAADVGVVVVGAVIGTGWLGTLNC